MLRKVIHSSIDYLKNLNLYVVPGEETIEHRNQQINSTRVFLILFILSLFGLVSYTNLALQLKTIHLQSPSLHLFEQHNSLNSNTLKCPCSQTFIQFNKFLHVNVSYHQICSSIFIDDEWISSISHSIPQVFYTLDIRRMLSSQLQLLASLCQSSERLVTDALTSLASNQLFMPKMLSRNILNSQTNIIVMKMIENTINERSQSQHLIQAVNQPNQLIPALSTSFQYSVSNEYRPMYSFIGYLTNWTYPPSLDNFKYTDAEVCFCTESANCSYPSGIYPNLTGYDSYTFLSLMAPTMISSVQIPGLYVGCAPLESLMQSTLECFYQYDCLAILFNTTNVKPLNISISSFPIDIQVGNLIEKLFIENWSSKFDFEVLFNECQPIKCSYTYNAKGNIAFVVITILSFIGGLFVSLNILAPYIVKIYEKIKEKIRILLSPSSNESDLEESHVAETRNLSIKVIVNKICEWIINLNLFPEPYSDDYHRRNEIISTRIYVITMIVGITVIVFYAMIAKYTLNYYINSPSLDSYRELIDTYSDLTCECKQITNTYSSFISFSPTFHQLCSRTYATDTLGLGYTDTKLIFSLDTYQLIVFSTGLPNTARSICDLIIDASSKTIKTFLNITYVSTYLTREYEFQIRMKAAIDNFKNLGPLTINHLLQLILDMTQGNQLLAGTFTNGQIQFNQTSVDDDHKIDIIWSNRNAPLCGCGLSANSCAITYDQFCNGSYTLEFVDRCNAPLPGLIVSCYIMEAGLLSDMHCLYDVNCINKILQYTSYCTNIPVDVLALLFVPLDSNALSRFYINSTFKEIIRELAIENWNEMINYHLYYKNCNPIKCTYTITKRFHIPTILTIVSSLVNGLSVILKILIPNIVKLIRRYRRRRIHADQTFQFRFKRINQKLSSLNFFKTNETDESIDIQYEQMLSTRFYILLWIFSITFLSIYTGLSQTITHISINSPSITTVKQFQLQNLDDFICLCSKPNIPFERFTSSIFSFHQICSSDLISNQWLENMFVIGNQEIRNRGVFSSHFQLLRSFCQLSNTTLVDAQTNFNTNQFISISLLTENEFQQQTQSFIDEFQTTTIGTFRHNLQLIIDITLGNQLMNVYETNWYFIPSPIYNYHIFTKSRSYGNCSCGSSQSLYCIEPLIINENLTIQGMMIGCLPLTSLRLSTLECFYDENCFNEIKQIFNLQNFSISTLNSYRLSQYSIDTTLNHIIDNLMLEQWLITINYSHYFHQCNLTECNYSELKQNNVLIIFTTFLGLYGGLIVSLKFVVLMITKCIRKVYNRYRMNRRIVPQ